MAKTPAYHAGRIMGMRDAEAGKTVRSTTHESESFRKGYCDGYNEKSLGLRF